MKESNHVKRYFIYNLFVSWLWYTGRSTDKKGEQNYGSCVFFVSSCTNSLMRYQGTVSDKVQGNRNKMKAMIVLKKCTLHCELIKWRKGESEI